MARMTPLLACICHLPHVTGQYSVGWVDVATTDVTFRLFYPHKRHANAKNLREYVSQRRDSWSLWQIHRQYVVGYMNYVVGKWLPTFAIRLLSFLVPKIFVPILLGVEVSNDDDQRMPVVIFSHGTSGCRMTYSVLCSNLASRGCVVAAVEHTDGSACTAVTHKGEAPSGFYDWLLMHSPPGVSESEDYSFRRRQLSVRKRECCAALNVMRMINDGVYVQDKALMHKLAVMTEQRPWQDTQEFDAIMLKQRLIIDRPVVVGHSFGAVTALDAVASGAFSSTVCLDPWLFPIRDVIDDVHRDIGATPVAIVNYEKFVYESNQSRITRLTHGWQMPHVTVRGARHQVASDVPSVVVALRSHSQLVRLLMSFLTSSRRDDGADSDRAFLTETQALEFSYNLALSFIMEHSGATRSANSEPIATVNEVIDVNQQYLVNH